VLSASDVDDLQNSGHHRESLWTHQSVGIAGTVVFFVFVLVAM